MLNVMNHEELTNLKKMNPVLKVELVEALRSGRYTQGRGYLNKDGKLCCLGVECELLVEKGMLKKLDAGSVVWYDVTTPVVDSFGGVFGDAMSSTLPMAIHETVGLDEIGSFFDASTGKKVWAEVEGSFFSSLTEMNDFPISFEEIAEFIETYL